VLIIVDLAKGSQQDYSCTCSKYCCMASFFSFTALLSLVQEASGGARTHLGAPHTHMGPKCLGSQGFFFQFCDVAEVVIIHKMI
jgi:hypothetical protein